MKNLINNFNIFLFDSITKFNLYDKRNLLKINKLKIFVKLKSIDVLFLKNFLFLSKLFFELFNRKIFILKILNDQNKIKNSIIFYVGFIVNNMFFIYNILNYLINIIFFSSKKTDDCLNFKKINNNFLFFFKNINYFIGLNLSKFSKWDLDFNFLFIFNEKTNLSFLNKKIVNFYEKLFF
jgi:hypothetical protein